MEQTMGKRIAEHRKRLMLTQDQLAEQLGVTAQAVSKWENDQSCPDISILPKLAEIFGTTTDELLGIKQSEPTYKSDVVHEAEVVDASDDANDDRNKSWEVHWDGGRRRSLGFPVFVLSVGILYLLSQVLNWELSLWDVLWPTSIFIFGFWGLFGGFSFFRMICALFGGYTLADKIFGLSFDMEGKLLWAVLIVLFGISLLADALKKPKWYKFIRFGNKRHQSRKNHYNCTKDSFTFSGSFCDRRQNISLETLREGEINVSFGDYIIDLSAVSAVTPNCCICFNSSFADLTLLIPKRYQVIAEEHNSFFADIKIKGSPDANPVGQILLSGNCCFGDTIIRYV